MVLSINTNIPALNAQRHLSAVNALLARTYRRLASGQRIVSAADDPAGLAMSERLRARIRSLSRARLNANDGISTVQVAEGALNEVSAMLVRMRELAIQASNGLMSENDRDALQQEFDALDQEINRIASASDFNGQNLLSGGTITIQIGAGTRAGIDTITLSLPDMRSVSLGIDILDIGSSGNTEEAIQGVDGAIDIVTTARGDLGAFQNRLTHAINNLGVEIENLSAADSRIRDADMAQETARLVKYSIIQQAAVAVLAQAKDQPYLYIKLLN
jgi:flagellin